MHHNDQHNTLTVALRKHAVAWAAGIAGVLAVAALFASSSSARAGAAQGKKPPAKPTIVLVHGARADGSSWNSVTERLQADGYTVGVPPNPLRSLSGDSTYLASFLSTISGPIVLAGHSYGGVDTHRAHVMRKLNLRTRAEMVLYALANGLIGPT